jgi:hypothetical protein
MVLYVEYILFCFKSLVLLVGGKLDRINYFLQEEQIALREVQWEQNQNHSLDELQGQRQYATDLEKQIQALAQKLQLTEAHYKQKVDSLQQYLIVKQSSSHLMFKQLKVP